MYSLKKINQIRWRLSLLEYISRKSVALLTMLLEASIELIYLHFFVGFICFCTAKTLNISLHLSTIIAFTPFSIRYSTTAAWLLLKISLRVIIFIIRRSKRFKRIQHSLHRHPDFPYFSHFHPDFRPRFYENSYFGPERK